MSTFILNNECIWENGIHMGNQLKWLNVLVDSIKKPAPPLANSSPEPSVLLENASRKTRDFTFLQELQGKKVFVDAANEDQEMASRFKERLDREGIKSVPFTPQDDPTEMFNQLEGALGGCDTVVTFYNNAPLSWLAQRLRYYQVVQAKRKNKFIIRIHSSKPQPKDLKKLPSSAHWENLGSAT